MTILELPKLSLGRLDWLISMQCSHKTFHFLSVSDGPTSILSDIAISLRKSHEIKLWHIFGKPKILARDVFETSQRRHGKDIFFEICPRRLKDVTQKTSFLKCFWDVLKTSQKGHLFWDVSKRSLRYLSQWRSDWDLSETSHAGWGNPAFILLFFSLDCITTSTKNEC